MEKANAISSTKMSFRRHLMLCGTNGQLILVEWSEGATGLDQWLGVGPDHSTQRRGIDESQQNALNEKVIGVLVATP